MKFFWQNVAETGLVCNRSVGRKNRKCRVIHRSETTDSVDCRGVRLLRTWPTRKPGAGVCPGSSSVFPRSKAKIAEMTLTASGAGEASRQ